MPVLRRKNLEIPYGIEDFLNPEEAPNYSGAFSFMTTASSGR